MLVYLNFTIKSTFWGGIQKIISEYTLYPWQKWFHNHFILNPISFIDGKKIDSGFANYFSLRETSDELCLKYGLSIIKDPKGHTPRNIYFDEKAGKPTRYNLMRWAIDEARKISPTWGLSPKRFSRHNNPSEFDGCCAKITDDKRSWNPSIYKGFRLFFVRTSKNPCVVKHSDF